MNASRVCVLTKAHARPDTQIRSSGVRPMARKVIDTEEGILSGISRKCSIRSRSYWFTEFCNSQCLSHFAAPFIVVRAETSVAESCILKSMVTRVLADTPITRLEGQKTHVYKGERWQATDKENAPSQPHHP